MTAKEALALTVLSQEQTKENLKQLVSIFVEMNMNNIRIQAERGFKTTELVIAGYEHPTEVETNYGGHTRPKWIFLDAFEVRVMRKAVVDKLVSLGYTISKNKRNEYVVSWGEESNS